MTINRGEQTAGWLDVLAGVAGAESAMQGPALSVLLPRPACAPSLRFAGGDAITFRSRPGFSVDRPYGKPPALPDDGVMHDSVHFKARPSGPVSEHLLLVCLATLAADALGDAAGAAMLEQAAARVERQVESSMFGAVNIFAQAQILEETLNRLEAELALLEASVGAGVPGNTPADIAARLGPLRVALDEKSARAEGGLRNTLRLIREGLDEAVEPNGRQTHGA